MQSRIPLVYTFGNHMHWVDMQWLWGYGVLPGSTEDMLAYCQKTGAKGCLNFDGIGLEKMASEAPEHLAMLRQAISEGIIEVVGGSYGQPYGLFHGGESNIRQRIYGIRTSIKLLNHRPRTFWEEEFDFYPQLPQMLKGLGFTGASLYFQWTWHTPEIPFEEAPVIDWQGVDGTKIPTAARGRMNLHQWPEDFRILLNDLAANPPSADEGTPPSLVLQWLELMPTQDWMCRSELMTPMLMQLKNDPRFDLQPMLLTDYLALWQGKNLPVRQYKPDDVWHGMTLGKNGDNHPKTSAYLEQRLLESETAAALLSLFGRPYKPWDIYPTWEMEECWRNLLAAQHHDNHECEGLCGHVAEAQFAFVETLLSHSSPRDRLAARIECQADETLELAAVSSRTLGWQVKSAQEESHNWTVEGSTAFFSQGDFFAKISLNDGEIVELTKGKASVYNIRPEFVGRRQGEDYVNISVDPYDPIGLQIDSDQISLIFGPDGSFCATYSPCPDLGCLRINLSAELETNHVRFDSGYGGSMRMRLPLNPSQASVRADLPCQVYEVEKGSNGRRKYPSGDWMTSPQWFESVEGAFVSHSFVDWKPEEGSGLLICHEGGFGWFRKPDCLEMIIQSFDPWDEEVYLSQGEAECLLAPHNGLSAVEALEFSSRTKQQSGAELWMASTPPSSSKPLPRSFTAVTLHSPHVLATAFYREESAACGRGLENYAGDGIQHPFVLRLVEVNGEGGEVAVTLPGPIAHASRTNLMGEIIEELEVLPGDSTLLTPEVDSLIPFGIEACQIKLTMQPYEIATLYLDIVPGRKVFRDLDAKREIWATVHRTSED